MLNLTVQPRPKSNVLNASANGDAKQPHVPEDLLQPRVALRIPADANTLRIVQPTANGHRLRPTALSRTGENRRHHSGGRASGLSKTTVRNSSRTAGSRSPPIRRGDGKLQVGSLAAHPFPARKGSTSERLRPAIILNRRGARAAELGPDQQHRGRPPSPDAAVATGYRGSSGCFPVRCRKVAASAGARSSAVNPRRYRATG